MANETLPRIAESADVAEFWSVVRDNQLREVLETADVETWGVGVVSGGLVEHVSGFTVRVPTGSIFRSEGKTLELTANADYNPMVASDTVYIWGKVTRTAADPGDAEDLDEWALVVSHNLTGTPASALHFLLAIVETDGSAVTAINNVPAGKFFAPTNRERLHKTTIPAGEGAHLASDEQLLIFDTLTVAGVLGVAGQLRIIA